MEDMFRQPPTPCPPPLERCVKQYIGLFVVSPHEPISYTNTIYILNRQKLGSYVLLVTQYSIIS